MTTILVVEDDPDVGAVVCDLLRAHGYDVALAKSAPNALAVLAATPIDLVLTDIRLNSHSGRWLARQLRTLYPKMPFVLMSGYRNDDSREARVEAVFIAKPFAVRDLIAAFAEAGLPQEPSHA